MACTAKSPHTQNFDNDESGQERTTDTQEQTLDSEHEAEIDLLIIEYNTLSAKQQRHEEFTNRLRNTYIDLRKDVEDRQSAFEIEAAERRMAFETDIHARHLKFEKDATLEKQAFDEEEAEKDRVLRLSLARKLQSEGIAQFRKHTRPAYIFERFLDLPVEIQVKIWSMATRIHDPLVHKLFGDAEGDEPFNDCTILLQLDISDHSDDICYNPWNQLPSTLYACALSREIAKTVYTLFPVYSDFYLGEDVRCYANTLYDEFILFNDTSRNHGLECLPLLDLIMAQFSGKDLPNNVKERIDKLCSIRRLRITLGVFNSIPPELWKCFSKLEDLMITFGRYKHIEQDIERIVKIRKNTETDKRAKWVHAYAHRVLDKVVEEDHSWKKPKISARLNRDWKSESQRMFGGDDSDYEDEDEDADANGDGSGDGLEETDEFSASDVDALISLSQCRRNSIDDGDSSPADVSNKDTALVEWLAPWKLTLTPTYPMSQIPKLEHDYFTIPFGYYDDDDDYDGDDGDDGDEDGDGSGEDSMDNETVSDESGDE